MLLLVGFAWGQRLADGGCLTRSSTMAYEPMQNGRRELLYYVPMNSYLISLWGVIICTAVGAQYASFKLEKV